MLASSQADSKIVQIRIRHANADDVSLKMSHIFIVFRIRYANIFSFKKWYAYAQPFRIGTVLELPMDSLKEV